MEPEKKIVTLFLSGLIEEIGSFLTKARFYLSLRISQNLIKPLKVRLGETCWQAPQSTSVALIDSIVGFIRAFILFWFWKKASRKTSRLVQQKSFAYNQSNKDSGNCYSQYPNSVKHNFLFSENSTTCFQAHNIFTLCEWRQFDKSNFRRAEEGETESAEGITGGVE